MAIALAFAPALGQFRVALEPAELGRVEITVRRMGEAHQVLIVAERPETLALLQRDRAELDRALAESGVAVEDAGIGFSLESRHDGASHGGGNQSGGNQGRAAWTPAGPAANAPPAEPRRAPRSLLDLNV
jgi:Meckel syndrome type 1 protein